MNGWIHERSAPDSTVRSLPFEHRVSDSFALPMRLEAWVQITQCGSVLGPLVQIHASLLLSDLRARLTVPGPRGDRDEPGRVTAIESGLTAPGERLARPHRPAHVRVARGQVRFTVTDRSGHALGDEAVTVRCVDGARGFVLGFPADVSAALWITTHERAGDEAPRVDLSGELHFPRGVALRVGDPDTPAGDAGPGADVRPAHVLDLVLPGRSVPLQRDSLRGDLFEGSQLAVRFVDAANHAFGSTHRVGLPAATGVAHGAAGGATP